MNAPDNEFYSEKPLPDLPVCTAVVELVEILVLGVQQFQGKNKALCFKVKSSLSEGDGQSDWFLIKILCFSLPKFTFDIEEILNEYCPCLCQTLKILEENFVGPFLSFCSEGYSKETTNVRNIIYCLQNDCVRSVIHSEGRVTESVSLQIKMSISFYSKINGIKSEQHYEHNKRHLTLGSKKLVTDLSFYQKLSDAQDSGSEKVFPKSGFNCVLKDVKIDKETKNLLCSCVAFVTPPVETQSTVCNAQCTKLKVLFYGAGHLPLGLPGQPATTGISPNIVFNCSEYGLNFGNSVVEQLNAVRNAVDILNQSCIDMMSDWSYSLTNQESSEDSNTNTDCEADFTDDSKTLFLIFVLDVTPTTFDVEEKLEILHCLRKNLGQIMCRHRQKFRKASKTAVNKILSNYSVKEQKEDILMKSIPIMVRSICDVVKHSTNNTFREKSLAAVQCSDVPEMRAAMSDQLWHIAGETLGIKRPEAVGTAGPVIFRTDSQPATTNISAAASNTPSGSVGALVHKSPVIQLEGYDDVFSTISEEIVLSNNKENYSATTGAVPKKRRVDNNFDKTVQSEANDSELSHSLFDNLEMSKVPLTPLDTDSLCVTNHQQTASLKIVQDPVKANSLVCSSSFDLLGSDMQHFQKPSKESEKPRCEIEDRNVDHQETFRENLLQMPDLEPSNLVLTDEERRWFEEIAFE